MHNVVNTHCDRGTPLPHQRDGDSKRMPLQDCLGGEGNVNRIYVVASLLLPAARNEAGGLPSLQEKQEGRGESQASLSARQAGGDKEGMTKVRLS